MIGVDFGTSTTIAALYADGRARIVRSGSGDEVTPTYVAYLPDGKVAYGRAARGRRVIDPGNTLFSFKRILGRNVAASEVRAFGKQYPFQLEAGADQLPRFVTRAGKLTALEVTSTLLAHLREAPDLAADSRQRVVMTVPVSFRGEQRSALLGAAMLAGFRSVEIVEEPCAAALACLQGDGREQFVAVYDLGGGTFDLTVVHQQGSQLAVLAAGGDSYLGGDDITQRCAAWVADQVLERFRWDIRTSKANYDRLLLLCEAAKASLSTQESQEVVLSAVDPVLADKSVRLTRALLEKLSLDLVQRTFLLCDETLRRAGLATRQINAVVLSGGCCYMPLVQRCVRDYFGQQPRLPLPPDKVVALGAALQAGTSGLRPGRPSG